MCGNGGTRLANPTSSRTSSTGITEGIPLKTSCVPHVENDHLVILRYSYLTLCDGHHCAAALLNFFEYWHNIKLEMQPKAQANNAISLPKTLERYHGD